MIVDLLLAIFIISGHVMRDLIVDGVSGKLPNMDSLTGVANGYAWAHDIPLYIIITVIMIATELTIL